MGGRVPSALPSLPHATTTIGSKAAATASPPNRTPFTAADVMGGRPRLPRRHTLTSMATGDFPGAMAPERQHQIDVGGLALAVHQWGSQAAAPPVRVTRGF